MKLPDAEQLAIKTHERVVLAKRMAGITSLLSPQGDELMVPYERLPERAKALFREEARAWLRVLAVPADAED
jgi:hypothetical protein